MKKYKIVLSKLMNGTPILEGKVYIRKARTRSDSGMGDYDR